MSIFSDRINGIMSKRHISQKQLANWANVTESAMSYYVIPYYSLLLTHNNIRSKMCQTLDFFS